MGSGMPSWGRFTPGIRDRLAAMNAANLSHGSIEALNEFYQNQYDEYIRKNRALLNFAQSLAVFDEKDAFVRKFASRLRVESAGGYCI